MRRFGAVAFAAVVLSACALKGDVRRVERQVQALREETARADSARADFLQLMFRQVLALQRQIADTLEVQQRRLDLLGGDVRTDMTEVQRQLLQIQELTGQSQQRLTELEAQLNARAQQDEQAGVAGGDVRAAGAAGTEPGPNEIYDISVQQLRRGSPQTARMGFRMLLEQFPDHERAADAMFHIGESWEPSAPDSAAAAYETVAQRYSDSPRAPTALYRLGLLAEQRGDLDAAQVYYQRVVREYPGSDAAELARGKLNPE